ncbi:MAG TPA: hypothetical protein ENK18_09930 [Deltaproteobacteria bacterium]|nr:hypothetical protein [Deltaproteobacteria bacterium]
MANKDREQRRSRRLAKQRKRRARVSRPARDGGSTAASPSFKAGLGWPPGDCFASEGYDLPGASPVAVFSRSHADGRTLAAIVELDRRGPGVIDARVLTAPSADVVLAECGRLSEARGVILQGVPPEVVVGLLLDARAHGGVPSGEAWSRVEALIEGIEPMEPDAPFGPAPPEEPTSPGLLDRLFRYLG